MRFILYLKATDYKGGNNFVEVLANGRGFKVPKVNIHTKVALLVG